jgi:hypothetical protein
MLSRANDVVAGQSPVPPDKLRIKIRVETLELARIRADVTALNQLLRLLPDLGLKGRASCVDVPFLHRDAGNCGQ